MRKILYILLTLPLFAFGQVQDSCYSVTDFMSQTESVNPAITKNFTAGWNMFGYPCTQSLDLVEALSSIIDKVIIVKNNNGSVYMPEFGFNGIGYLESGEGYQIKLSDTEYGFSFCESINWPDIDGCTDCEAVNFDQWATNDDGSCNYDSDGDGVPDSEEVVGCQDSLACDYNINATDGGECYYAEENYDCDGNLLIYVGAEAHGGIVFYYDSIGDFGLVAAASYANYGLDVGLMPWGCYNQQIIGADSPLFGYGHQNTIDIVQGCDETPIAAKDCFDYVHLGYDDWWLPSKEELELMYDNIGFGSELNNIGDLKNAIYWTSTETTDEDVWAISFTENGQSGNNYWKSSPNSFYSRPVRAFGNWTMGCMDETACNYNPNANMADGSCEYAEQGYDCNGNITAQIGDIMEGGYLFYLDESGSRGLVAAIEDLATTY